MLGDGPEAQHIGNVALYAAACFAAALFVFSRGGLRGHPTLGGIFATMWWVSHPVHTEAVASVVGRAEILCALFGFVAAAAARRGADVDVEGPLLWSGPRVSTLWYAATFFFLVCATLSKETGVTVAVVCAAPDVCRLVFLTWHYYHNSSRLPAKDVRREPQRLRTLARYGKRPLARAVALAMFSIAYMIVRKVLMGTDTPQGRFEDNPLRFLPTEQVSNPFTQPFIPPASKLQKYKT